MKIGSRFVVPSMPAFRKLVFNRDPILRSKSQIDFAGKIGIRFCDQNRIVIVPDQVFDRDRDRDRNFKTGIRL